MRGDLPFTAAALLACALSFAGCLAARQGGAARRGELAPCPSTPNCVSSLSGDGSRRVAPLPFAGSAAEAMRRAAALLEGMPRTRVVLVEGPYLRAECRSALFGFVDDLELLADEAAGVIHVRSASRVGSWDLGVNRRRVEGIRRRWEAAGH